MTKEILTVEPLARVSTQKKWRVVYVKSRSEKKVKELLTEYRIESYVPLQIKMRKWSDRMKRVEVPAINGYVFVKISDRDRIKVLQLDNVIQYVRFERKDAEITQKQIDMMKKILGQSDIQVDVEFGELQPGQSVMITAGHFMGMNAQLVNYKNKKRIAVRIEQINFNMSIEVPLSDIEVLNR